MGSFEDLCVDVLVSGLGPVHKHWLGVLPCEFKTNNILDEFNCSLSSTSQVQVCQLTHETISHGLSLLCRTGNGLAHAFVKLDLKEK